MKTDISDIIDTLGNVKELKSDIENAIAKEAAQYFIDHTPIRTGNARANTDLRGKTTIVADYPYAQKLEEGYSSQAPAGMIAPTEEYIKRQGARIAKGVIDKGVK